MSEVCRLAQLNFLLSLASFKHPFLNNCYVSLVFIFDVNKNLK